MAQKWVSTYNVGWQMTQKSGNEFEKVWENKTKKKKNEGIKKEGGGMSKVSTWDFLWSADRVSRLLALGKRKRRGSPEA